jgi:capsule polysaccharide export protein KpsE/RkpR
MKTRKQTQAENRLNNRMKKALNGAVPFTEKEIQEQKEQDSKMSNQLKYERAWDLFDCKAELDVLHESIKDLETTLKQREDDLKKPTDSPRHTAMYYRDGVWLSKERLEAEQQTCIIRFRRLVVQWNLKKQELLGLHHMTEQDLDALFKELVIGKKKEDDKAVVDAVQENVA